MLLQYKGTTGEQVVYVNEAGLIVQAPVISTTLQNSVEMVLPAIESSHTVVTYDQCSKTCRDTNCWTKRARKKAIGITGPDRR